MLIGLTDEGKAYYTMVTEKDVAAVKSIPLMLWTPIACMEKTFNPDEVEDETHVVTTPVVPPVAKAPPGLMMTMTPIPPLPPDATRMLEVGMDKCIHGTPKGRACRMCMGAPVEAIPGSADTGQKVWTPPVETSAPVHMAGEPPISPLLIPGVQQFNPLPADAPNPATEKETVQLTKEQIAAALAGEQQGPIDTTETTESTEVVTLADAPSTEQPK